MANHNTANHTTNKGLFHLPIGELKLQTKKDLDQLRSVAQNRQFKGSHESPRSSRGVQVGELGRETQKGVRPAHNNSVSQVFDGQLTQLGQGENDVPVMSILISNKEPQAEASGSE
ncbi:hypothetical protein ElyMa_002801200 [Elysia marginata]|uniref:Uncharacterized protein n=1 Tax=Elysia marginata TaxID=1093978 RepID=A0AAV4HRI1_9GAST|nr:hypothetical protein ElyMa_002801200 [Elysia marginata]